MLNLIIIQMICIAIILNTISKIKDIIRTLDIKITLSKDIINILLPALLMEIIALLSRLCLFCTCIHNMLRINSSLILSTILNTSLRAIDVSDILCTLSTLGTINHIGIIRGISLRCILSFIIENTITKILRSGIIITEIINLIIMKLCSIGKRGTILTKPNNSLHKSVILFSTKDTVKILCCFFGVIKYGIKRGSTHRIRIYIKHRLELTHKSFLLVSINSK